MHESRVNEIIQGSLTQRDLIDPILIRQSQVLVRELIQLPPRHEPPRLVHRILFCPSELLPSKFLIVPPIYSNFFVHDIPRLPLLSSQSQTMTTRNKRET